MLHINTVTVNAPHLHKSGLFGTTHNCTSLNRLGKVTMSTKWSQLHLCMRRLVCKVLLYNVHALFQPYMHIQATLHVYCKWKIGHIIEGCPPKAKVKFLFILKSDACSEQGRFHLLVNKHRQVKQTLPLQVHICTPC